MIFSICARCGKRRLRTAKRAYLTLADSRPIATPNEICGRCHRKMKAFLKANNLSK